jgi:Plasmid replication region DNA-binding N-term
MALHLTDHLIRSTCRELMSTGQPVTGRGLRRALRERFGAAGKTSRVFGIWRQEMLAQSPVARPDLPIDTQELQQQLIAAQTSRAEALARAERAEYREQAHQDHWAMEIDRLREELKARPKLQVELRALQEQVLRLTAELHAARALLARES